MSRDRNVYARVKYIGETETIKLKQSLYGFNYVDFTMNTNDIFDVKMWCGELCIMNEDDNWICEYASEYSKEKFEVIESEIVDN